ncbi:MAG: hypothetical protein OEN52_02550, partial [Gammaproteobacteria bacterium]|nr:hypothetical protein [Gammaproteobacteria bacterium]
MLTRRKIINARMIAAGIALGVLGGASVIAADNEAAEPAAAGMLPTNARAGECYAKVMVPAEYKTVEEKVVVAEASEKIEVIPA